MNRIKELRIEKGLLQSDVAKYIGKSERIVGFYENGARDPSTDTLIKLSELFNVSIDYILCKSDVRDIKETDTPEIRAIARDVFKLKPEKRELFKSLLKQMSDEADEASKK